MRPFQLSDIVDLYIHPDDRSPVLARMLTDVERAHYEKLDFDAAVALKKTKTRCSVCRKEISTGTGKAHVQMTSCGDPECKSASRYRRENGGIVDKANTRRKTPTLVPALNKNTSATTSRPDIEPKAAPKNSNAGTVRVDVRQRKAG